MLFLRFLHLSMLNAWHFKFQSFQLKLFFDFTLMIWHSLDTHGVFIYYTATYFKFKRVTAILNDFLPLTAEEKSPNAPPPARLNDC